MIRAAIAAIALLLAPPSARAEAPTIVSVAPECSALDQSALERILAANLELDALAIAALRVNCLRDRARLEARRGQRRAERSIELGRLPPSARTRAVGVAAVEMIEALDLPAPPPAPARIERVVAPRRRGSEGGAALGVAALGVAGHEPAALGGSLFARTPLRWRLGAEGRTWGTWASPPDASIWSVGGGLSADALVLRGARWWAHAGLGAEFERFTIRGDQRGARVRWLWRPGAHAAWSLGLGSRWGARAIARLAWSASTIAVNARAVPIASIGGMRAELGLGIFLRL